MKEQFRHESAPASRHISSAPDRSAPPPECGQNSARHPPPWRHQSLFPAAWDKQACCPSRDGVRPPLVSRVGQTGIYPLIFQSSVGRNPPACPAPPGPNQDFHFLYRLFRSVHSQTGRRRPGNRHLSPQAWVTLGTGDPESPGTTFQQNSDVGGHRSGPGTVSDNSETFRGGLPQKC